MIELFRGKPYIMGVTAELIAQMHNLSREEIDEVALRSHNNAERATKDGDFREEIVPVEIPQKKGKPPVIFERDEHFRPGLTMADLAALARRLRSQERQGYGGQLVGRERRRERDGHHVRRKGSRAWPETPRPDQGGGPGRLPPPPSWG